MTRMHLPRVARRLFNRPQYISPDGAAAVAWALAERTGVTAVAVAGGNGEVTQMSGPPPMVARNAQAPRRRSGDDRLFAFDQSTGIAYVAIEGELAHRQGTLEPSSGITGYDGIKVQMEAAATDPMVRGILLDVDSPGGEVYGAEAAAQMIYRAREIKPVWAVVNEMALSAGYYLASQAGNVFVAPAGDAGSIGAVVAHMDMSRALDDEGVTVTIIASGVWKAVGNPFEPLPEEQQAWFQARVDESARMFAAAVERGRGISAETVLAQEARIYMGQEAVDAGLADEVAIYDEVVAEFAARLRPGAGSFSAGMPAA